MITKTGYKIPVFMIENYLSTLVNQFFKILPIRENNEPSLTDFMKSLQRELLGFGSLMESIEYDSSYISLVSILQYLIDNECEVSTVKQEVFKAISLCKKLKSRYCINNTEEVEVNVANVG